MIVSRTCPKCGSIDQFELQYDNGWQIQCLTCSKILSYNPQNGKSKELKKQYSIEDCTIPSPMDVNSILILAKDTQGFNLIQQSRFNRQRI